MWIRSGLIIVVLLVTGLRSQAQIKPVTTGPSPDPMTNVLNNQSIINSNFVYVNGVLSGLGTLE